MLEHRTCINNKGYLASLVVGKKYLVFRDRDEEAKVLKLIWVIDESGCDYLYPEELFSRPEK